MNDKTILVTGGAGFIGTNFVRMISEKYPSYTIIVIDLLTYAGNINNINDLIENGKVHFIKADIANSKKIINIFESYYPDYVINFAAESHVDRSILNSKQFILTNIVGTHNLLESARKSWKYKDGFKKDVMYLQVSTDEVYGSIDEGYFTEETPIDPHSPYSASKASADIIVKSFVDTYGFPAVITRCSNNYGPYQFPEKLIPIMIHNIISGKKLPIYGDGKNVRDWIHVLDHCNALFQVLQKSNAGEIYNIGSNNEWSNIELINLLIKIVREEIQENDRFKKLSCIPPDEMNENLITFVRDRPGHDKRYAIDNAKMKKVIGWEPEISFKDGLKKTVKWYLQNYNWVQNIVSGEYKEYYQKMYTNRS